MFKKALIILSLSSVVVVPSLATQVQAAALPTQEKATTYASNKKIRSATYGEEIWVSLTSPIPAGWVIVRTLGTQNLIRNVNGASY
ncbi:hypothetical protein LOY85_08210, partial [Brevibacillus brevis]